MPDKQIALATELGHRTDVINLYEKLKKDTMLFDNEHISELDIIYFLGNIMWSTNFELVAKVIKQYGYEERSDQWRDALAESAPSGTIQRIAIQRDMQLPDQYNSFPVFMLSDNIKALVREHNSTIDLVSVVKLPKAWHIYVHTGKLFTRLAIPHQ